MTWNAKTLSWQIDFTVDNCLLIFFEWMWKGHHITFNNEIWLTTRFDGKRIHMLIGLLTSAFIAHENAFKIEFHKIVWRINLEKRSQFSVSMKYQDWTWNQAVPLISNIFVSTFDSTHKSKLNTNTHTHTCTHTIAVCDTLT